jgi:hypothetical protein
MRLTPALGAAAISLALPVAALAQAAPPAAPGQVNPPASTAPASTSPGVAPAPPPGSPSNMPPASPPTSSAAPSAATAGVNTSATITAGLPVKDKTGASIGSIAGVKSDANGKQTATIKMGADTFAVDTAALALDNGSATINATQAEIRAMMKKGGK